MALTTRLDHNGTRRMPIPADAPVAQSQVSERSRQFGCILQAEDHARITAADPANAVANNGAGWRWTPSEPECSRPRHEDLSGPLGTVLILLRIRTIHRATTQQSLSLARLSGKVNTKDKKNFLISNFLIYHLQAKFDFTRSWRG